MDTIRKHGGKALKIFQMAEKELLRPSDISENWLNNIFERISNSKGIKPSLLNNLVKEGFLTIGEDQSVLISIKKQIEPIEKGFKRLLEIYLNERMELRKRQLKFDARNPLSLSTVRSDMVTFVRLVRWLQINKSHVSSWDTGQQEDIHEFLLTLTLKHREIVRKDLVVLFKLAKRKRIITHIPILDVKSREFPPTIEPLTFVEQVKVVNLIKSSLYERPLECLLTSLCLYHGLSSSSISKIKATDINLERKIIYFQERPPVYLSEDEMILVSEYAKRRVNIRNVENKTYLIISCHSAEVYKDQPVNNHFIARKVKELSGFTPKSLRITCFNTIASHFGPQLLVEGFGLSLTQASRYGKLEDYLIEAQIQTQRENISRYSDN
ncbi:site-specific integrase [Mesobacillus foraminis]|uniref:site-specific integrase n=1 Tax=Mesobacillus foraminis TaxID=279826 RepID=UPI0020357E01|nr:site-specific integrase [Mesobacillus foraminis]